MELETREITTAREAAQINAPTIERQMKGDIVLSDHPSRKPANLSDCVEWRDNDRAGHATATAKQYRWETPKIERLHRQKIINDEQFEACWWFNYYFEQNINEVIAKIKIATWQNSGLPRCEWQPMVERLLHDLWCFNYLRNPANGLNEIEFRILADVICVEESVRDAMNGDGRTKTKRFQRLVERLRIIVDGMPGND